MPIQSEPIPFNKGVCIIGEADLFLANLLHRFAEKSGFQTRRAQTGEAVLELARQENPALVVLEPDLPGKQRGWEAARALFSDPSIPMTPLVMCAWMSEAEVRSLVGQELAYLQKPDLHYSGFTAAVKLAVEKARQPGDENLIV